MPSPVHRGLISGFAASLLLLGFPFSSFLSSQELPIESEGFVASEGSIPVKLVGGRLVARVELSTIQGKVSANLFIDFETRCGLRLDDSAAQALETENEYGVTNPISIAFPDFTIEVDRREQGAAKEYADFTRLHSSEINEEPLVGAIGSKILSRYQVTFDLGEGRIELALPTEGESEPSEEDEQGDTPPDEEELVVGITTKDGVVFLPVQLPGGNVHALAVSTTQYDSLIDSEWCEKLGAPDGDVGALNLGALDLSQFVAFRPSPVLFQHPDEAIGVAGLNLLQHLRLTIDRKSSTATCVVSAPPDFPVADREFFKAMVAEDADQLEACLEKYPRERLSEEAAQMLLAFRIRAGATPEQVKSAIRRVSATWREDMVSTEALILMGRLRDSGYPMLAVFAGEQGIEGGRKDRYPNSIHQLHASMGEILLDQDEVKQAWRHLLSAAFGVPDDGAINLNLGRVYEKQERYNRALSRYVQAVIQVETGEKALEGLERVQRKMGNAQSLSVDTIAPLIAGKTYNYAAATRYRPKPEEETNRVSLVEFFTNTHFKKPGKEEGAIGGALGNEGIMTYFPRSKVAMLTYHLIHPDLDVDSLANEFSQYRAEFYRAPPAVQMIDGTKGVAGQGHLSDAELVFQEGRDVILTSLKNESDFELELSASIQADAISGSLEVKHLKGDVAVNPFAKVQIVLAEKGVLYPGKSKIVIQRMVVRAALTDDLEGILFEPEKGSMTIPFSKSLSEITRKNVDYLKKMGSGKAQTFAAKMDPRQLTLVAIVRDGDSTRVLQAIQVDPTLPEENEPAE